MENLTNHLSLCFLVPRHFAAQLINMENASSVKELILLGLSEDPGVQKICFVLFLFFYMIIVAGNLLIIITVTSSQPLSSPMYFFLCYLSFVDICYSSVTAPKMLADFLVENKTISFVGCIAQLFGVHFFGCTEIFILTVMAYDRYLAICRPLHYTSLMTRQVCGRMVIGSWVGGFMHSVVQTLLIIQLPFCGPNKIDHYFCDVHPLLQLACTDTYATGIAIVANSGMISLSSFFILVMSYVVILVSLKRIGWHKALSTCGSHITVVILFFGPCTFIYIRPSSNLLEDKSIAVFYTVIAPMLNPLIYTLRNEEVKTAMRKLWSRKVGSENGKV
ncbi:olfactory receptor 4S2-like [Pezoporus occidentalis]|uniref:olfactory receptor 4S2-like n=1 Tax=Pezoporus occidentalis TaxID=407982 RepID=UPI002F90FA40